MEDGREYTIRAIPIDGSEFLEEVEKLNRDGWQLMPNVHPVAVYHLVRDKNVPVAAPFAEGRMIIDESKVFVVPAEKK